MATCYRHPTRETGVSCSSCGRSICPDCMTPTSVGMRCPECAREKTRVHRVSTLPTTPVATQAIIAINVAAYIAEIATGAGFGSVAGTVSDKGGLAAPLISINHEYWRLLTSGFLHASFFHILFNMYFIWMIGRSLEPAIGTGRFVALYLTSLLCGSLGVVLLQPHTFAVGASGAAFGLLGAIMVEARSRGIDLWQSGLQPLALLNFAISFGFSGIAWSAHVGGFAGGLLIGVIFDQADRRRLPRTVSYAACAGVSVGAVVAAIALA